MASVFMHYLVESVGGFPSGKSRTQPARGEIIVTLRDNTILKIAKYGTTAQTGHAP
jgi:hypothetical protein